MSKIEEKRGINSSNFKVLDGLQDLPCIPDTNVHACADPEGGGDRGSGPPPPLEFENFT